MKFSNIIKKSKSLNEIPNPDHFGLNSIVEKIFSSCGN